MKIQRILIENNAYSAGISDGMRGQHSQRASSVYGPNVSDYERGYAVGAKKREENERKRQTQAGAEQEELKNMHPEELESQRQEIKERMREIEDIADRERGSSFDPRGGIGSDMKAEYKDLLHKLRAIDNVLR